MAASGSSRTGDGDGLALPAGELGDLDVDRLEADAHVGEVLLCQPAHGPVVQQRPPDMLPVEEHVVINAQLVDQRQVLVDGVDSQRARVVHRLEHDLLAAQHDPAGIG